MTKIVNTAGTAIDFGVAIELMDDEIREQIHADIAPCTEQEFFDAYAAARHMAESNPWARLGKAIIETY